MYLLPCVRVPTRFGLNLTKKLSDFPFSRLNAHYGVEFVLGSGVDERKVTGKLNLKDDIDEVMRTISFTSSISYRKSNGKIWVNVTD